MEKTRLPREQRSALMRATSRAAILAAATALAEEHGFQNITRNGVAARAGVANGLINHSFGTMDGLRDELVAEAIKAENLTIIGQALASGHPALQGLPPALKEQAAIALAS